jgi:hypothetical protein
MKKADRPGATGARAGLPWGWPARASGPARAWRGLARRPDLLPGFSLAARPGLLVLTALLLVGLCAALAAWGTRPGPDSVGNDLLADGPSLKLNNTSAEAPASPPLPAPQPEPERLDLGAEKPIVAAAVRPAAQTPPAGAGAAVAVPDRAPPPVSPGFPPPPPAAREDPDLTPAATPAWANGYAFQDSHRGDSPMIRNWKTLGWPLVLAGALAGNPSPAADSDTGKPATDLAAIAKQLEEVKKSLESLEGIKSSILALDKEMRERLSKLESNNVGTNLKIEKAQSDIEALRNQITQLQRDVDALKTRPATQIAGYPPNGPAAGAGRLRLVNTFFEPMTFIVNGQAYDVSAGGARVVEGVPAGTFTYEVLRVQPPRQRELAAGETFTITVHPQPGP